MPNRLNIIFIACIDKKPRFRKRMLMPLVGKAQRASGPTSP